METSPLLVKGCKILAYAQRLWADRDLYRATPAVTRGLSFSGLIRPPHSVAFYDTQGDVENLL
jgi:hypothetical protein